MGILRQPTHEPKCIKVVSGGVLLCDCGLKELPNPPRSTVWDAFQQKEREDRKKLFSDIAWREDLYGDPDQAFKPRAKNRY